jgi:hypothetical protein
MNFLCGDSSGSVNRASNYRGLDSDQAFLPVPYLILIFIVSRRSYPCYYRGGEWSLEEEVSNFSTLHR